MRCAPESRWLRELRIWDEQKPKLFEYPLLSFSSINLCQQTHSHCPLRLLGEHQTWPAQKLHTNFLNRLLACGAVTVVKQLKMRLTIQSSSTALALACSHTVHDNHIDASHVSCKYISLFMCFAVEWSIEFMRLRRTERCSTNHLMDDIHFFLLLSGQFCRAFVYRYCSLGKTIAFIECAERSRFNSSRGIVFRYFGIFHVRRRLQNGFYGVRTDDGRSQEEQQHVYRICPVRLRLVTINAQTHECCLLMAHGMPCFVRHGCLSFYTTTDGCMRTD